MNNLLAWSSNRCKCLRPGYGSAALLIGLIVAFFATSSSATTLARDLQPSLGVVVDSELVDQWNITIFPDGTGLPAGSGTAGEGAVLYQQQCLVCHGPNGQGALAEELAGGEGTLTDRYPDKTIGLYWPFATTVFDIISRSMPINAPGSLSHSEVYALTAYLLSLNSIIDADLVLNADTLTAVRMPNRAGFIAIDVNTKTGLTRDGGK